MPPLPSVQRFTSLGGVTTEGFHAALVLAGIAPSEAFYDSPTPYELQALWETWNDVYRAYGSPLAAALGSKANRRRGRYGGHGQMIATLRQLSKHCEPLDLYIQPGITPPELRALIPPLDGPISQLLSSPPFQPFGSVDATVLAMAKWFKADFMVWADPIQCRVCGGDTTPTGSSDPTTQERADGGGRVEEHTCKSHSCGAVTRFVRYGHVRTLVKTRKGRCGEWAHLFYAFLRAAGIEARYIWNSEDHVWSEYWSPELDHWVHVDSCEAATNKPLLYARGWGKKQSYCLAFGPHGAEDITRAYVDDWPACLQRRKTHRWSEYSLRLALLEQTMRLRSSLSPEQRDELSDRDSRQKAWMENETLRIREAERDELGGRTSGTADWRAARHELGLPKISKPSFTVKQSLVRGWTILGNARSTGNGTLLTDGPGQTSGTFSQSTISQSTSFRITLVFKLDAPPGAGEADGIAVVVSPENKLGVPGYGMGYSGLGGTGDFAIEIDTFRTQDHADDPPTPHISVHSPPHAHHRHSLACTPKDAIPFLSNGKAHKLEIIFEAPSRQVSAFLTASEEEEIGLWQAVIPSGNGQEWYVGITGACGGLWQRQEIVSVVVEALDL